LSRIIRKISKKRGILSGLTNLEAGWQYDMYIKIINLNSVVFMLNIQLVEPYIIVYQRGKNGDY